MCRWRGQAAKKRTPTQQSSPRPPESFPIDGSSGLLPTAGPLYLSTIFSGTATLSARLLFEAVRASGCRGVQSSGGNATRQNVGCGVVNSRPISALPERTGPRNATWHSCSSCVFLCCRRILEPLISLAANKTSAPCALIASVSVSSSILLPCVSVPRIRTATCINTR